MHTYIGDKIANVTCVVVIALSPENKKKSKNDELGINNVYNIRHLNTFDEITLNIKIL